MSAVTTGEDPGETTDGGASAADSGAGDSCWFEYLGDWTRCEGSGHPDLLDVPSTSAQDCVEACLEEDGCRAIVDYFWLGAEESICQMMFGTCDEPIFGEFNKFDPAREYLKVCGDAPPEGAITELPTEPGIVLDSTSGCVFRALPPPLLCEGREQAMESAGADTVDECLAMCQERSDCSAVDIPLEVGESEFSCSLHLATCDAPEPSASELPGDNSIYLVKYCGVAE